MKHVICIAIMVTLLSFTLRKEGYVVTEFGAVGDGKTLNTEAIQKAIDQANKNGGGKVIIPEGEFLSGSIILKSNVELHLEEGAVLLGTTDPHAYITLKRWKAFVMADGQTNIAITGKGTIDGQGREVALNVDSLYYIGELGPKHYNLRRKRPNEYVRPQNIEIVSCKNVLVNGITVKDAASWVQTYEHCENVVIDGIKVDSDAYWNNDGMDIDNCKNVRITNCFVNSADDGICLKSGSSEGWNDSIYIANCTVRSSASAIKFGTASAGGFKNVKIENIKVYDTFRSAIALESVDGGILENVEVDGVEAVNTGNAIFIRLGHRNSEGEVGELRNVSIKNVHVQVPFGRPDKDYDLRGPDLPFFHNPFPSSITGIPGHYVENVKLENITIIHPGRGNNGLAIIPLGRLHDVPEKESSYPEFSMFGELPAWGFYVRHVKGISMKNVTVKAVSADYRPAFVLDDVQQVTLSSIQIEEKGNKKQVILKDVQHSEMDEQVKKTARYL